MPSSTARPPRPNSSATNKFSSNKTTSWGFTSQEKAEQIDRLQSNLAAALTSEQAQLQAIQQRAPGWTAGKKKHAQWEQQVARRKTRIAQIALRLDRVGEIEEAAGVYAETKIEELTEPKLRFDHPEQWDKIQRREREASILKIEQSRSLSKRTSSKASFYLARQKTNDNPGIAFVGKVASMNVESISAQFCLASFPPTLRASPDLKNADVKLYCEAGTAIKTVKLDIPPPADYNDGVLPLPTPTPNAEGKQ